MKKKYQLMTSCNKSMAIRIRIAFIYFSCFLLAAGWLYLPFGESWSGAVFAQAPQGVTYQAIARDSSGVEIINTAISIRASIISDSPVGTVQWEETHAVTTNQYGLFTLIAGQGANTGGGAQPSFAGIDWGSAIHFLKIEMDPTGGTSYLLMGTEQILSVPYALFAENSGNVSFTDTSAINELQAISISNDTIYLSNGGFVVLPPDQTVDADADPTNELQAISISNDTIYLANGGFVKLPVSGDNDWTIDADTLYSAADSTVTIKGGNVGIGTTSPDNKLHIYNSVAHFDHTNLKQTRPNNTGWYSTMEFSRGTGFSFNVQTQGDGAANTQRLRFGYPGQDNILLLENSGNVGIGTTTPLDALHVIGNGRFSGNLEAQGTQIQLNNKNTLSVSGLTLFIGQSAGWNSIALFGGLSERLRIDNVGNIGIGTSAPDTTLHIAGALKLVDGTQGAGKILTSDSAGMASWQGYAVGDFAQGGIVFWVDETGQHGLVCAKTDQSTSMRWYAGTDGITYAFSNGPYSGEMNTSIIIPALLSIGNDGSTFAARVCNEYFITIGSRSYGDWYLPSEWELLQMYQERAIIATVAIANGGTAMASDFYWSSTDGSAVSARAVFFFSGGPLTTGKSQGFFVRSIRVF